MFEYRITNEEIENYLIEHNCTDETKIYIGCDSERFRIKGDWYADYILVLVLHVNGANGAKVFGEIQRERIYDKNPKHPQVRLMNEAIKLGEFFLRLEDVMTGYDVEIHLDLNPKKEYKSSMVINEAIGYIKGLTSIDPKVKPEAFAASYAADRFKSLGLIH